MKSVFPILSALIIVLLTAPSLAQGAGLPSPDLRQDNIIDINDLVFLNYYIASGDLRGDLNQDQELDRVDRAILHQYWGQDWPYRPTLILKMPTRREDGAPLDWPNEVSRCDAYLDGELWHAIMPFEWTLMATNLVLWQSPKGYGVERGVYSVEVSCSVEEEELLLESELSSPAILRLQ